MPTSDDMRYARPLCRRRRIIRNGQHGIHITCWAPMTYQPVDNSWWCSLCKHSIEGYDVAQGFAAIHTMAAA